VIRLEGEEAGRVRVIGALQGQAVRLLFDAISQGPIVLDLSQVTMAEESAVRLLAELPPERCDFVSCPTWLALWVERMRPSAGVRPRDEAVNANG
jgi:hypothetical protein